MAVPDPLRISTATCPNGHPLDVGQLVCDVCTGTAGRRRARATAGALLFLSEPQRQAAVRARQTHRIRQVLLVISGSLLAASSALLVARSRPDHQTIASSDATVSTTVFLFPPIVVPTTTTTEAPTKAFGCPQNAYADLSAGQASKCLYLAWKTGDQRGTEFYASVPAVESLFSRPWAPPDQPFEGCGGPSSASTTIAAGLQHRSCRYRGITMQLDCTTSHGCSVVSVAFTS